MTWEKATSLEQLTQKSRLHKSGKKQIALFLVDGRPFAIDNRCPHEGYPLTEGSVDDSCVLTCNWHNWKFRLEDGECILGGDHVRAYPAKIEDGHVYIDTAEPPKEQLQQEILRGLRTAVQRQDFGRICREIARFHFNGLDPEVALVQSVTWTFDRWEFGTTHAYVAAADWLLQSRSYPTEGFEKRLVCLAEAVDYIAFDSLRQRAFPYPAADESFRTEAFVDAVEKEERDRAEAMMQSALDDGLHWSDIEEACAIVALAHYNDFGHSAIYVYKTAQFIDLVGSEVEPSLLLPLTRHLCFTTREDLIPEFKAYPKAITQLGQVVGTDQTPLTEDLFGMNTEQACQWVAEHFSMHHPLRLYETLLTTLARSMLHFDLNVDQAFDRPVSQNVGWLDFTHGLTFGNAVRNLCTKYPRLWSAGLLQMACFLGRNRPFVDRELDESRWLVDDSSVFWQEVEERLLDHGMRVPIFAAHVLKTAKAVEEEMDHVGERCQRYLLAALNRFLHSPIKQKHIRRLARQAIALVERDFG